jgi:Arc/MetJ-type ribon-helix-helix transcriptional regulator
MITIDLPKPLEKHLRNVVQESYQGNMQSAIKVFLKLHEKYGWKEQLLEDVKSVRSEVRRRGGIKAKTIDEAIKRYRKSTGTSGA